MPKKQKEQSNSAALHFLAWFTGVVVSLVVGNSMINKVLKLPSWLGGTTSTGIVITQIIGWVVVITTLISVVMAIIRK